MQFQSWRSPDVGEVDVDVCIMGAGPAGITVARELDRPGLRICIIESGGAEIDRRVQRQSHASSVGYPLRRLHDCRKRVVGGTLRHPKLGDEGWAARPLDPVDFEERAGVEGSGWPLTRAQMEPYYARAQAASGLDLYDYQPGDWSDPVGTPLLALDDLGVEDTVFHFAQPTFQEALPELSGSSNVVVLLRSRVVGMTVNRTGGEVDEVLVCREDGSRLVVHARVVVLAAGGIENARLLLLGDEARGIGNEHDLVGRFFAERLSAHGGHVVPARPGLVEEAAFYSLHHVRRTLLCGALRLSDETQRVHRLRNCAFYLLPRPRLVTADAVRSIATLRKLGLRQPVMEGTAGHLRSVATGAGQALRSVTRGGLNDPVLTVRVQAEQAPNPSSRVTLGSRRDDLGLPTAEVRWRFDEADLASVRTSLEIVSAALQARGLGSVMSTLADDRRPTLWEGMHHHMGTTRMHEDPRRGVVNPDCRVHSMRNVYVAGSSVFPTYGASNPTLTIVALAHRLADHLRVELGASRTSTAGTQ
jgi:choline dehydrogenase-like flavoprotein